MLVDEAEALVLVPVLVAVDVELSEVVVLFPLTASQIWVLICWVAVISVSIMSPSSTGQRLAWAT